MAFTAQNIASYLERMNKDYNGRRIWAEQFAGVDANRQAAIEGVASDYSDAVATAYLSSLSNKAAIGQSNLISGQKEAMLSANDEALEEAYKSYLQNHTQSMDAINANAAQARAGVNTTLTEQSEMFAKYGNAHLDYLEYLYSNNPELFDNERFANYMTTSYNDNGDAERVLMGRGELENLIFDPSGGLTTAGRAFFDQMENDELLRDNSFGSYLQANDEELYNWAMSDNPYNYSPDAAGRNTMASSFAQFAIGDTEEQFENIEYFFGLTPGVLNKRLSTLNALVEDIGDKVSDDEISSLANEMAKILSDYDLVGDYDEKLRAGGHDSIESYIKTMIDTDWKDYYTEPDDITKRVVETHKEEGDILNLAIIAAKSAADAKKLSNEARLSKLHDLIVEFADMAKAKYDENVNSFYNQEAAKGYTVQAYDKTIAKSKDGTNYDYRLSDGSDVRFLSGAELKGASNVRDVDNDNFKITYGGLTFKLEAGKEKLDSNVMGKVADKVSQSLGRQLRTGDVFYYDNKLWVVTKNGNARNVRNRVNATDYRQLMSVVKGDATLQDITAQRAANMS